MSERAQRPPGGSERVSGTRLWRCNPGFSMGPLLIYVLDGFLRVVRFLSKRGAL